MSIGTPNRKSYAKCLDCPQQIPTLGKKMRCLECQHKHGKKLRSERERAKREKEKHDTA